jgi:radical SAM superfamily enzyme YgiQ (UPF0313 family)
LGLTGISKYAYFYGFPNIVDPKLLLITPPFTQLNTPYPATAYLKGFLNTKGIAAIQDDLGIAVILELFSEQGLSELFEYIEKSNRSLSENAARIVALQTEYVKTIDVVIQFLQGKNPTLALPICQDDYLPEASRFSQLEELDWAFGSMGTHDKAKHLATLYLEDLSDLIIECVDEHFGFSRYAERLGRSAASFDELDAELQKPYTYIDEILIKILKDKIESVQPDMLLVSVPFPGNLYAAFRSAQWIKKYRPEIKTVLGGGFANTELRSLSDKRVFGYFDFVTLDDGERPVELLVEHIEGKRELENLKRTFAVADGKVQYFDGSGLPDYKQSETGTPDYTGLPLNDYISVIEIINPMHRLWSDGRWNKLTMAHGCYWGKCTFCDISLDYISMYEPIAARILCDRIEELVAQTGQNGFHFVDEAAPPALMRELALEILRRKLSVTWWTNIRFEKSFTKDLCILLKASGCIAVSGGLEVASDRLLSLIDKGVTVEQVAKVTRNFTDSGIMVHAYLMYGYPTQTVQETIDSLEMVRQMFEAGILQSGFWHQFAMTAHSPVGMFPERFGVEKKSEIVGAFANNDIDYIDRTGIDHDQFSFGLRKSLYNYMHGICFDYALQDWFEFRIPKTTIPPDFITTALEETVDFKNRPTAKVVWLGGKPSTKEFTKSKKGNLWEMTAFTFHDKRRSFTIETGRAEGVWLQDVLQRLSIGKHKPLNWQHVKEDFENAGLEDFEIFWTSRPMQVLRQSGLLVL